MPKRERTWRERRDAPDRRTFVLQLYDNVKATDRFEEEAKRLDAMAHVINNLLGASATTIRHSSDAFHCYVGTSSADKILIVMRRTTNAMDWGPTQIKAWCRSVANQWLTASGRPTLAGNEALSRPGETSDQAADLNVATRASRG